MSVIGKRVIYAGPADGQDCKPLKIEGAALAAIAAGSLVASATNGIELDGSAATAFGSSIVVADKDQLRTRSVDDAWTSGENMVAIRGRSGEFLNVIVAAGNNITKKGVALTRNGSGKLQIAATDGSEQILAYSDEVVNVTSDALVRVYVA